MKTSKLYALNLRDAGKGLIVAIIGGIISAVAASINAGSLDWSWKQIGMTALSAGLAYLVKIFFTPADTTQYDETK